MSTYLFRASWSALLKISTIVCIVLILSCMALMWMSVPATHISIKILCTVLCALVIFGVGLFAVRGYGIEGNNFVIYRLVWTTRFPLSSIVQFWEDSQAMKGSWRIFGIGGLFVFAGIFRNKKLGTFNAYATNPQNSVVVKLMDRTIVVTPDAPSLLVAELNKLIPQKQPLKA